jgi:3-phenylpropionate/trans-cinnamate dioxygenase ferredoxin subunit
MRMENWIEACKVDDIEEEDVIRFDHGDRTFAIYRTEKGDFYASDGYCTHERFHLSNGLVIGNVIECPKHNGRFDIPSGKAKKAPVCIDLRTYPVKLEAGKVFIKLLIE